MGRILRRGLKIPERATSELTEQVMRVLIYFRPGQIFEEGLQKIPSNMSYKDGRACKPTARRSMETKPTQISLSN